MHALLKFPHGAFGAEEMRKDGAIPAEGLFPAMGALADRVFQMPPHRVQRVVRIADVAGQRVRAVGSQEFLGFGSIDIRFAMLFEQSERDAGVQQARKLLAVRRPLPVEDPELDSGEHGLRTSKGIDQIKNECWRWS